MSDSDAKPRRRRPTRSASREQRIAERRRAIAQSPCLGICAINQAEGACIGCFRTIDEITDWLDFDEDGRARVLRELPAREARFRANSAKSAESE